MLRVFGARLVCEYFASVGFARVCIVGLVLSLSLPQRAAASSSVVSLPPLSPSVDARVAQAMSLYEQRSSLPRHTEATRLFSAIAESHPEDRAAQLWCARTAYYCAHRYQGERKRMKELAALGDTCGQRLRARSGDYEAQLWSILARSKALATRGWIPPLGKLEKLARQLQVIAEKNPDRYGTYLLLGAVFRELPGWPLSIGDDELALEYLQRGWNLAPKNAELLLELAATYKALDQEDAARAIYLTCIREGTGAPDLSFETAEARNWAKKMLKELD